MGGERGRKTVKGSVGLRVRIVSPAVGIGFALEIPRELGTTSSLSFSVNVGLERGPV